MVDHILSHEMSLNMVTTSGAVLSKKHNPLESPYLSLYSLSLDHDSALPLKPEKHKTDNYKMAAWLLWGRVVTSTVGSDKIY